MAEAPLSGRRQAGTLMVPFTPSSPEATTGTAQSSPRERVWDLWVRIGHWSLVLCVAYSLLVEPEFPGHDWCGYVVLGIVGWRWTWGFIGTRYARFTAFIFSPRETLEYTRAALRMGAAREYGSHNPMGALMVFAFLLLLPLVCLLGMMVLATQQLSGPLAGLVPVDWDLRLETLHAVAAYLLAALIGLHVIGVAWASWWHRENYLLAMITGFKSRRRRRRRRTSIADRGRSHPGGPAAQTSQ